MAGCSEGDILADVQRTITEFPDTSDFGEPGHGTPKKNSLVNLMGGNSQKYPEGDHNPEKSSIENLKEKYKKQIEILENEITILEDEYHQKCILDGLQFNKEELDTLRQQLSGLCPSSVAEDKAAVLLEKLEKQTDLSGVQLEDAVCKVHLSGPDRIERQHILQGNSFGLEFTLDFDIIEEKVSENETKGSVTRLKILVDDDVGNDLAHVLNRIVDENAVQQFFQVFVPYAEWRSHRQTTFQHFEEKYPDLVKLPNGDSGSYLQFQSTDHLGPVWTVSWSACVSKMGQVSPDIQLCVKAPKQMIKLDHTNTLSSAPEYFSKMCDVLGVERAIDIMIQSAVS